MMNKDNITTIFNYLQSDYSKFFAHVSDTVKWTVMGTHPLAGEYNHKQTFIDATFAHLSRLMREPVALVIDNLFVDGDHAIVEMHAESTLKSGKPFANHYCWVVKFENDIITEVRAYLDSALVKQTIEEEE